MSSFRALVIIAQCIGLTGAFLPGSCRLATADTVSVPLVEGGGGGEGGAVPEVPSSLWGLSTSECVAVALWVRAENLVPSSLVTC